MQKVVGSNPIIRSTRPWKRGLSMSLMANGPFVVTPLCHVPRAACPASAVATIIGVDTTEFDQKIEAADGRLKALREEMSNARDRLAAAIAEYASGFWEQTVKKAVSDNPFRAKELGDDGMGALKSGLAELQNGAADIVQTKFVEKIAWPDASDDEPDLGTATSPYEMVSYAANRIPSAYEDPLRRVLGSARPLLADHGLLQDRLPNMPGGDRYPFALNWPEDLHGPGKAYADLYKEFREVWRAKLDAETAKAKAEAEDMWDRA
jgi:hypothetical protein